MFDLTLLYLLVYWIEALRWPLVAIILIVAIYFLRRGPERNSRWQPPAPTGGCEPPGAKLPSTG